jgi:histidinol-phosphatase (PHP family)
MAFERVSIHGGHSGEFCNHAFDSLEAIVRAYIEKGFAWVGISEHMPPVDDRFLYPEERDAGLDVGRMHARFLRYIDEGRRLQRHYAGRIEIFIGFETEACSGALEASRRLARILRPDYVLGGVHHVDDIPFDYSEAEYRRAEASAGGPEALYCRYFDLQMELIETVRPDVVAHFDLIRLYDPGYRDRLSQPSVARRIRRNLEAIARYGMILDFNVAALRKGAGEPYPAKPLLEQALEMNIPLVPGDDAHSAAMAGTWIDEGIALLRDAGCDGRWVKPAGSPAG